MLSGPIRLLMLFLGFAGLVGAATVYNNHSALIFQSISFLGRNHVPFLTSGGFISLPTYAGLLAVHLLWGVVIGGCMGVALPGLFYAFGLNVINWRAALPNAAKAIAWIIALGAAAVYATTLVGPPALLALLVIVPYAIHHYWRRYRDVQAFGQAVATREYQRQQFQTLKGTAHYATAGEIQQHKLNATSGLRMGKVWASDSNAWLPARYDGPTSILTIGPSGSGKFATAIAPVLLDSQASFLVNDPKGEIYAVTAPFRRKLPGHQVFLLDPFGVTGEATHCYNPLEDLDPKSTTFESDAATIAGTLIIDSPREPFWTDSAKRLISGLIVYVCTTPGEAKTLLHVLELLHLEDIQFLVLMKRLKAAPHRICQMAATPFLTASPAKSTAETVNTARTQLDDFLPYGGIEQTLSRSDFSFRDLKRRAMTIYVVLPQAEAMRFNRFTRLLFGWAVKLLQGEPGNAARPPACLLIDEMATSIGNLDIIKSQFALARGYGFQLWGIFQDINQMIETFGKDGYRTVLNNAGLTQYFATSDHTTIEAIQQRAGTYTRMIGGQPIQSPEEIRAITGEEVYDPYGTQAGWDNVQVEGLPLVSVQLIQGLPDNRALVFKNKLAATVFQERIYYKMDRTLASRAAPNPFG